MGLPPTEHDEPQRQATRCQVPHDMPEPRPLKIPMASWQQLQNETWRFTLSPDLWTTLDLPQPLNWNRITFDHAKGRDIPNDRIGVYAFVLEPNIACISLAYLLYVGKTTEHFRARFYKYKRDQRDPHTNRPLVRIMLNAWPGRVAFYYAPIEDRTNVQETENQLIAAFKPPVNRKYPARVRDPFKVLDSRG